MGQVEYIQGKVKLHHEFWEITSGERRGDRYYKRFQNLLLGAKRGSNDKPGVLKTLHYEMNQLRERNGWEDLTGTVWDTTRMGKKAAAVGDSWRFVRRLEPDQIEEYLVTFGAKPEELDLSIPPFDFELPDSPFYVDPEPYSRKVSALFGGHNGGYRNGCEDDRGSGRGPAKVSGAGFGSFSGSGPDDDDIPF
jgi:hypothetical protein